MKNMDNNICGSLSGNFYGPGTFPVFDAHCDTLTGFDTEKYDLYTAPTHYNVRKQCMYGRYVQVVDIWVDSARHDTDGRVEKYIDEFHRQLTALERIGKDNDFAPVHITTAGQLRAFYDTGRTGIDGKKEALAGLILGIEGGECIDGDAAPFRERGEFPRLKELFGKGVRLITLTWNTPNNMSDTNCAAREPAGLTDFGRAAVREMNRLGIVVDLSHISDKGFWDTLSVTEKPVVASHSDSRELCPHSRNLTDDMFRALIKNGGVTGINFCTSFLGGSADVEMMLKHIDRFCALGGVKNVGIGSDLDGIEVLPGGIDGAESLYKIFDGLLRMNYTEDQVRGIAYGNFQRVFEEALPDPEASK
jgi:membrane dipeptidase